MTDQATVTGRDRVVAAYKGGYADRVPAYPIAGSFAGCLDGLSIEEYCTTPSKAARAMLNYYERYQPDIMIAFNDLAKEAEAVGCHVKYSDYVVPSIDRHVLQDDKGRLARLDCGHLRADLRRNPVLAYGDSVDRIQERVERGVLQQVAHRAGAHPA